ncbi:MAG: hypothetical protein H6736_17490 [Alphaproteobacteria bacterium]|nr:hypothetical protein [Alphaproteobacteria bacterium]MCB9693609.1 hypothetical protein [Alphaproteobacteria bacterium]
MRPPWIGRIVASSLLLAGCGATSERGYYSAFFAPETWEDLACGVHDGAHLLLRVGSLWEEP